jgi:hypothetical protein
MILAPPLKDYTPKRLIAYDPEQNFSIEERDDDWCLEFLRFTKEQVKEIAFVLSTLYRVVSVTAFVTHQKTLWPSLCSDCQSRNGLKIVLSYLTVRMGWLSTGMKRCSRPPVLSAVHVSEF